MVNAIAISYTNPLIQWNRSFITKKCSNSLLQVPPQKVLSASTSSQSHNGRRTSDTDTRPAVQSVCFTSLPKTHICFIHGQKRVSSWWSWGRVDTGRLICAWRMWCIAIQLAQGLPNLIVWCVLLGPIQGLWDSSPGSNYKWAVCICMTSGIWEPLNQSLHMGGSSIPLCRVLLSFTFAPCRKQLCPHPAPAVAPLNLTKLCLSL